MSSPGAPKKSLADAMRRAYPELGAVAAAAGARPVYLVGGAVRDLLLGRGRTDLDLAALGDPSELTAALGAETLSEHERFGTAKVALDGHQIDIARARTETYAHPGALPTVAPADSIEADLARRDFTINAIALPLADPDHLVDPHGGQTDLEAGLLRVLHPNSFVDDPTRAIRAARYAARFGFALEAETEELLGATDFSTISAERREAELMRLAAEPTAANGLEKLGGWGLLQLGRHWEALATALPELLAESPWAGEVDAAEAWMAAALGYLEDAEELAHTHPTQPSQAVSQARGHSPTELVLARALGAEWLDDYVSIWRDVSLAIDGDDLIAAGIPAGPAIGRGLKAALRAKLDGEISGRDEELARALALARAREP
jgi:tRNA nucleotidyltransferase (CCA-adding enzyme)